MINFICYVLKHTLYTYNWAILPNIRKGEWIKIESFKMWCYRRMLKISWVDRVTNEDLLKIMVEKCLCGISLRNEKLLGWPCSKARWIL